MRATEPLRLLAGGRRRCRALVALLTLLSAGGVTAQPPARVAPRNVIFILADDHRYDFLGFHPRAPEWLETPQLDRIAREGMHLSNAFVSTALCSPSRASVLTGQYAHRHGVVDNRTEVPRGTRFFPQYLQSGGYATGFFGKWHMGNASDEPRPGFTRWVSFRGQGVYNDPVLNVDGTRVQEKGYIADVLTDYALEWAEQQRRTGKPFFLYLSHKNVHEEFTAAARHAGRHSAARVTYPETMYPDVEGQETWPTWVKEQRSSFHGVDFIQHGKIDFNEFYRAYAEALYSLDESIGRVMDYLRANDLADNTLVLYMADNGYGFGEHGLIDKRHAYEESIRVPMLAWAPGLIRPGSGGAQMVMNLDVMPTVLEVMGVAPPGDHVLDGRSMLPIFRGEATVDWRTDFLYEYYWEWAYPQTPTQFALRNDRHKYVSVHGVWDSDALYDLQEDPLEKRNLIRSPEHRALAQSMRERLFARLEATDGMKIPLRAPTGNQSDLRRGPDEPSTDPLSRTRPGDPQHEPDRPPNRP